MVCRMDNSERAAHQDVVDRALNRQLDEGTTLTWWIKDLEHATSLDNDPFMSWLYQTFLRHVAALSARGLETNTSGAKIEVSALAGTFRISVTLDIVMPEY